MIENLNGIHETVKYKENSNVKLFINVEVEDYPIHWHTPMEIIMPLEGSYTVQIGDDLVHLNESDIIFIASGVKHRLIAPDTGKRLILQIEWSAVSKIKELNSILTLIAPAITLTPETSGDIHSNIRKLLLDIADEYQTDSFLSEAVIYSKMLEVLVLIGRHHTASSCHFNVGRHKQQEYLERFLSICEYIDTHCTEDITLDEIAKIAGFSKYHFTRLFKQFTNNTFYKYLNQKRI
ncbi:MAG TPA: AraC family transcriptional regulator, partial [Eubacterium sp.]|nr:AraC family transcriptional regulator [Eubacterium sp.]